MGQGPMSELVDFDRVESTHSQEERNRLMTQVAQLYSLSSDRVNPELLAVYDDVLVRLADLVEEEALAFVAEKLAPLANAPRGMVRRLADQPISVARPVLEKSHALSDDDLVEVASTQSRDHIDAIASRQSLSPPVTTILVDRGDAPIKRKLADNPGAQFSEPTFTRLVEDSADDEGLQDSLAAREDLPSAVVEALIDVGTSAVRERLMRDGRHEAAKRVKEAAPLAAERLRNDQWLVRYDFESAYRSVCRSLKSQPVDEKSVRAMAETGKYAEAVVMFALCAGVSLEEAKHWSVRADPKPFLIVCRALGFQRDTVAAFLTLGPWLRRLNREEREQSLNEYEAMSRRMAEQVFSSWKTSKSSAA